MSNTEKTFPTWGYHPTKPPKIFELAEGEQLPSDWADTPAAFLDQDGGAGGAGKDGGPVAEHRGAGRYYVIVEGKAVGEAMTKSDAEAFNAMSASDRAALLPKD